jgi:lincosamide nucleotidyltransferase
VIQRRLIERVRERCLTDGRLAAALMYGSFVTGEADEHSDIEFWLFFDGPVAPREWLARIGPAAFVAVNEFGAHVVFFPGLIRGEFHFATAADIASVGSWPARDVEVLVDRDGALRAALAVPAPVVNGDAAQICGRFANWLVLAHRVAARGELLRAVDALTQVQRHLLWMARLAEGRAQHWLTPSRAAETDLPAGVVAALHRATATADAASLRAALAAAWILGRDCWRRVAEPVPEELFANLDEALLQ